MAVLAVVTSSPPDTEGGHLVIARALVSAARDCGHDAHLVVTPDYGFGRFRASYNANRRANVSEVAGRRVDQVISLRYPSYAVRHPRHLCWLNHTIREYYDLWPRFSTSISTRARMKEHVRRQVIHAADRRLLTRNVTKVVAQSQTIADRLVNDFALKADVVYPPPPLAGYRCERYDDYIFTVSRLMPLKRVDLLIRAMAQATASHVRTVIAGEGECRQELEKLAASLGVANRITFTGRISDEALLEHLARCRAVFFGPYQEDYGFVTVEAFASGKAVVTCRDSGGPAEFISDESTGVLCDPDPSSIAIAIARLVDDDVLAKRLGRRAAEKVATMSWVETVRRLIIV